MNSDKIFQLPSKHVILSKVSEISGYSEEKIC